MIFFELIENQNILIEPNIIYLKGFTFENFKYGIPKKLLKYHHIEIIANNLTEIHSKYKIDVIFSGKNISNINIDFDKHQEQIIVINNSFKVHNISSGKKFSIGNYTNHPSCMLMFFLYETSNINEYTENIYDDFELVCPKINSIDLCIFENTKGIQWEDYELINVEFMGIHISVLCFDPQLKDYNKFIQLLNNDFDIKELHTLNFLRIDDANIILNFDSNKNFSTYVNLINFNNLVFGSGMAGLSYC